MRIDLSGRTAVVSGSTAGIGFATAVGLARAGATVVVNGRTQAAVDRAVAAIGVAVPGAILRGAAADLGSAEGCAALVDAEPGCDVLVNNVAIWGPCDFFDLSDADWTRLFEVNVMSGVRLSRAYGQGMAARGWGRIVFVSSESAFNLPPQMIHYGFTKTGLLAVSRGLAKRLAGTGVTVNAVLPGPTLTDNLRDRLTPAAEAAGRTVDETAIDFVTTNRPSSLLRRPATPDEVANLIVYVCSPQASATTGASMRVDGGVVETI